VTGLYAHVADFEERRKLGGDYLPLQVERPVTEEVSGLGLVKWQVGVAGGESSQLAQHEITATGHTVECRVYAEDHTAAFRGCRGPRESPVVFALTS
jgi:acetyl-CoA/propionyl-CoA/long-chain acyl-CoA carboxylase, biotin carboxylase, biotin carboxyl carrier protein